MNICIDFDFDGTYVWRVVTKSPPPPQTAARMGYA